MKRCNIAIYGCGTVGGGVLRFLREHQSETARRSGCDIHLSCVVDKRARQLRLQPELQDVDICTDPDRPLKDPDVDIIVELIGGTGDAGRIIEKALRAGKDVVTANKALLAERAGELFTLARKCDRSLAFEASVAGGIPVISTLRDAFVAEPITSIFGIVNGTCNYILTRMTEEGISYADALHEARECGYAEADPTLDVEGCDSAHKLAILARLAFGADVRQGNIFCEGISHIDPADLIYAGSLGYRLKLLAIGKKQEGSLQLRVHPALLHHGHPLSGVSGSTNAICIHGRSVGEIVLTGQGAGALPTAGAVVSDICRIARGVYREDFRLLPVFGQAAECNLMPQEDLKTKYYFRLCCRDMAGVLARVGGVLGEHNISIASCIQQEEARQQHEYVPVVFMTYEVKEKNMQNALQEINNLDCIDGGETVVFRVAGI